MAGPNYSRMGRGEVYRAVVNLAASTWPHDVPEYAIRGILAFCAMQPSTVIAVEEFTAYTTVLAGYLDVPMPQVPDDLNSLSDAQLVTLATALELSYWDFHRRANALSYTQQYWADVIASGGNAPDILAYRDFFLDTANTIRSRRGLPNLVA